MPTATEPTEFSVERASFSPRSLRHLLFKKHLRTVGMLTIVTLQADDDLVQPDLVVNLGAAPDAVGVHAPATD
jgi:hypothetical protein